MKRPPFRESSRAAKTLPEPKWGKQHQSMEPSLDTSARLRRSPIAA